jgi:dihydroorotase
MFIQYTTTQIDVAAICIAEKSGFVYGVKLYPAGATTNSQDGVTDLFGNCYSVLEEMVEQGLPLLVICLLLLSLLCFFLYV